MKNATRVFVSTFGAIMALAGIEHGIGEIFQGNVAPEGIMILSWPESELFRNLSGEPAMTIIPNMLITGILAVLTSLVLLVWVILFVHKKHGGFIMILISIAMLLLGGGIFPPVLAMIIGAVAIKIHTLVLPVEAHRLNIFQRFLARAWTWSYIAGIIAWLSLFPGVSLLEYFFGVDNPILIVVVIFFAFGTLILTAFSSYAKDTQVSPYPTGHL